MSGTVHFGKISNTWHVIFRCGMAAEALNSAVFFFCNWSTNTWSSRYELGMSKIGIVHPRKTNIDIHRPQKKSQLPSSVPLLFSNRAPNFQLVKAMSFRFGALRHEADDHSPFRYPQAPNGSMRSKGRRNIIGRWRKSVAHNKVSGLGWQRIPAANDGGLHRVPRPLGCYS